jgi:predicted MFS family arabinose efflux permease
MASITAAPGNTPPRADQAPAWGAIFAMTLCSFVLVASEFMPMSLLTSIAADLQLTQGQTGQAISVSGLSAMAAALFIGRVAGSADRRKVLLLMTLMLIVSGSLVAYAPTYLMLMVGRIVLGVAIGGFWSMSAAVAMRLVPEDAVPKALAVINGGPALATVVGAPAGSFIGGLIGWRGAFYCVVPLAVAATIWLAIAMPRLPHEKRSTGNGMATILRNKPILIGYIACAMLYMGNFSLYTYLRPYLEQVTQVGTNTISLLLLLIGVAGFIGTSLIGRVIGTRLRLLLASFPAAMAVFAVGLTLFGTSTPIVAVLLGLWGLFATSANVPWWTWVTRAMPEDPETGGGFLVAIVQFAIMAGGAGGGLIYDAFGPAAEFLTSAAVLAAAAMLALLRPGDRGIA